jgi:carbon storage regulator
MLVLTRKYQEKIRIGDNITITVLRTKGKAVRLGIEAPSDVPVIRGELSFETPDEQSEVTPSSISMHAVSTKRAAARRVEAATTWATDSPHAANERPREPQAKLSRMPRKEVAGYLPTLVAGKGALRGIMDQR